MRFKTWIGVFVAVLSAFETTTFAYQKVDLPGIKPKSKNEKPFQAEFITPEELKEKIAKSEPVIVVDLRGPSAFADADTTIKGSVHTKVRRVAYRLREVPRDKEIVTYCACAADEAAVLGAQSLLESGFKRVRVLKGGWQAWLKAGGQLQPKPKV